MDVEYSESFKRQLKRLSRRYRRIKNDIKPIVDAIHYVKRKIFDTTGIMSKEARRSQQPMEKYFIRT